MARAVRAISLVLAIIALVLWAGFYIYVSAMACAFADPAPCRIRMPWQLTGDDLSLLVFLPMLIVGALLALALVAHRRVTSDRGPRP